MGEDMPRTVALIHTSPVLVPSFAELARRTISGARLFHMVDESLIQDTIRSGRLEKKTIRRLVNHIESACEADADVVLVTCSSIGPAVDVGRRLFDVPVLRIDERMVERAVGTGRRIGVIATLRTTLEPTVALLRDTAERLGRQIEIEQALCEGAFEAVLRGDKETHDRSVTQRLVELAASVDVIVLAQASMARVADQIEGINVPILSSPPLAMEQVSEVLESLDAPAAALAATPLDAN